MAKAKPISNIDCSAGCSVAIRRVVTVRLEEMCSFRERALDVNEPEGVHDMRVASRRLRSALRDFVPHTKKRHISVSLKIVKDIADALGEVRDEDVAIIALEKLAAKSPSEVSAGVQLLIEARRVKRAHAQEKLIPFLEQQGLAHFQSEFRSELELATASTQSKSRAKSAIELTYREVARAAILDRLRELEKLSDSLYHPLKVKPLHKMRIAAKKLRYALELFEKCWGRKLILFSSSMAELQSSLGDLHDCDVWIVEFGYDLSNGTSESGNRVDASRKIALVWLLDHFVKQRSKHLRRALAHWRDWELNNRSEQLRKIIQSDAGSKAKGLSQEALKNTASASG